MVRISEMFYSIQGEGPTMGKPSVFLRLQACNLMCGGQGTEKDKKLHDGATWRCDTIEVWLKGKKYSIQELKQEFDKRRFTKRIEEGAHLIVTGGEPMLQQKELIEFFKLLPVNTHIEIETNGTIQPTEEFDSEVWQYNVSPKLSNSGMPKERRWIESVLGWHAQNNGSWFKFVVSREEDFEEIKTDFIDCFKMIPANIYLMPAASDRAELNSRAELIAELCKEHGVNYSSRLQLEIWDKATGV